jgi:Domain of unknown function (DUF6468)
MSDGLGLIIELLVAILLMFTIGYCILLNRRLKLLRADEGALRATIGELITATEIAERAIAGLKVTARECELGLGERLVRAERVTGDLDRKLMACKDVVGHLSQVTGTGQRSDEISRPAQDAQALAAAAQAFSERLRNKAVGLAA